MTFNIESQRPVSGRERFDSARPVSGKEGFDSDRRPVGDLLGVIIAGDMTEHGYFGEYIQFTRLYGLTGNRKLHYPVYEGYGNHDFRRDKEHGRVADAVSVRNRFRLNIVHRAPGRDGHYSWRWGDVHFVMVNLAPANEVRRTKTGRPHEARQALTFLKRDLKRFAPDGRRVVIVSHYGFVSGWDIPRWWSRRSADRFFRAIRGYNVIAFIHGHHHGTGFYRVRGLPVFNVGSPFYTRFNRDGRGHETMFRSTRDALYARDIAWDPAAPADVSRYMSRFDVKIPLSR